MYIVTAANTQNGRGVDIQGVRHPPRIFSSNLVNPEVEADYVLATKSIQSFVVTHEDEVPAMVAVLTANFVGMDISVFKLESISVRAPGELKTKNVSKDGILPT